MNLHFIHKARTIMFGGEKNPFLYNSERSKTSIFWSIVQAIVVALAINVTIYFLFIMPCQVDGPSMYPTLVDKELLFTNKIPTWLGNTDIGKQYGQDYKHGDIIIFDLDGIFLVKRIIGTADDTLKIESGYVYLNGSKLDETYLSSDVLTFYPNDSYSSFIDGEEFTVPEGEFFVLGDNRGASKDSRYSDIRFVTRDKLKGIVILRIWPLEKFGLIPSK